MRVFVTGATGFIGSALVPDLIRAGHQVLGLARSDAGARTLAAAGAVVHRGDLEDLESLRRGADQSDAVIHLAFNHDFSRYAARCEDDRNVIEALGEVLAGSARPLVVTSGVMIVGAAGRACVESDPPASSKLIPRAASEEAAAAAGARGARVAIVRLPQVHDTVKQGLVTVLIQLAREKGVSAYVGDGSNRWAAAHLSDTAQLYRLVLEKSQPGAVYHAVAEEGVPLRTIAETIGRGLNVPVVAVPPEQAASHFGWFAAFAGYDQPASSAWTREQLGWHPTGPDLLSDLRQMRYS